MDGEGCICFSRHKSTNGKYYRHISVRVAQTEYASLKFLQDTFGGHLNEVYPKNATKRTWQWGLTGLKRVENCYDKLKPYLRIKGITFEEKLNQYYAEPVTETRIKS